MKKTIYLLILCLIVLLLTAGCGEKGIDSAVKVDGERLIVTSVDITSKYTNPWLSAGNKSIEPVSSADTLIVVEGTIKGKADSSMCQLPSMGGAELQWNANPGFRKVHWFMCGVESEDKSFVFVFVVPKESTSRLFTLYFPADDVKVKIWRIGHIPQYKE